MWNLINGGAVLLWHTGTAAWRRVMLFAPLLKRHDFIEQRQRSFHLLCFTWPRIPLWPLKFHPGNPLWLPPRKYGRRSQFAYNKHNCIPRHFIVLCVSDMGCFQWQDHFRHQTVLTLSWLILHRNNGTALLQLSFFYYFGECMFYLNPDVFSQTFFLHRDMEYITKCIVL